MIQFKEERTEQVFTQMETPTSTPGLIFMDVNVLFLHLFIFQCLCTCVPCVFKGVYEVTGGA